MKKRDKSKAELAVENKFLRKATHSSLAASVLNNAIRWGATCFIVWQMSLALQSFSGQATMADIAVKFLGDFKVSHALAAIFGSGGIAYGYKQNRLRKKTIARLESRIDELEKKLDPKRSSSRLTPTGQTNPEDRE